MLRAAANGVLSTETAANEAAANEWYARLVPSDDTLTKAFEAVFAERPGDFADLQAGSA